MRHFLKNCPLLAGILLGIVLLTIVALCGIHNIYGMQEYDPLRQPLLTVVFTGINDDIYPWYLFNENKKGQLISQRRKIEDMKDHAGKKAKQSGSVSENSLDETGSVSGNSLEKSEGISGNSLNKSDNVSGNSLNKSGNVSGNSITSEYERPKPLRESTYEEYINHISADIYGDEGVKRAASYDFQQVDESYFDDALFIGDSRTVGLYDYTDLPEHADFLCETSLTVYKVLEENFKGYGTVSETLARKQYGKIYIMLGINELGRGTTEDFMEQYTKVVDTIHELAPDAKIIMEANMRVSGEKSNSDAIFNNKNINARNNAIATLADNESIFYIDVNEVVCDENGDLKAEYTHDQIHLLGKYNELCKQFLMEHGV